MNDSQHAVEALAAIRSNVLLLVMANEYLCEDTSLIKIGSDIDQNIHRLRDDISSLKKEFPGKFASEVETEGILEKIGGMAQVLQRPGKDIKDSCLSGELGRELESNFKSISKAVSLIKAQVHGKEVTYTRRDSVSNLFTGVQDIGRSLGSIFFLGAKILLCLIVIAVLAFIYLFSTMEKEGTLLKDITVSETAINEHRELLSQLETKKEEVSKEIESREKKDMVRGEKISLLELEVEIQKINQDRHDIEAEIVAHEKRIADNKKKIEDIKEKPFLKRLLRQ